MVFLFSIQAKAATDYTDDDGFTWTVEFNETDKTCAIKGVVFPSGDKVETLNFPSFIPNGSENYTVVEISGFSLKDQINSFEYYYTGENKIIIPASVTTVGKNLLQELGGVPYFIVEYGGPESTFDGSYMAGSHHTYIHFTQTGHIMGWAGGSSEQNSYLGWILLSEDTIHIVCCNPEGAPQQLPNMYSFGWKEEFCAPIHHLIVDHNLYSLGHLQYMKLETITYDGTYEEWKTIQSTSMIYGNPKIYCVYTAQFMNTPVSSADPYQTAAFKVDEKLTQPETDPSYPGHAFTGWYTDPSCDPDTKWDFDTAVQYEDLEMEEINENTSRPTGYFKLYAGWVVISDVKNSSSMKNGTVTFSQDKDVWEGATVELTPVPDPGYEYIPNTLSVKDASGNPVDVTNDQSFIMPGSDVTVSAEFRLKTFYIDVQADTNCNGAAEPSEGTMGSSVQLSSSTVDSRREFDYWEIIQGDISIDPATNTFTIGTSDIVVKAHFKLKPVRKYEYNIIGDGTVTPDIVKPIEGDTISLTVEPVYGNMLNTLRVFNKETGEEISIYNNSFTMPGADVIISAVFNELQPHYIVWLDSDGNELERRPYFPEAGDKTPAATSNTKTPTKPMDETYIYSFQAWNSPVYQGNDTVYSPIFSQVERRTFLVIWMNEDGSELDSKPFLEGDPEPITDKIPTKISVMGDYAYIFKEWGNRTEDKAKGTITYFAVFSDETTPLYGILVLNDGSGTASADIKSAVEGATVTLTATPLPGYKFKAWEVVTGDVVVMDDQFVMGTENVRIRATFEKLKTVYVSFDADGGTGSMTQVSMYAGSEYSLPNCSYTAPQGKEFSCWDISGNTYQPGETISVNDDITAKAVWKDKSSSSVSYTVTFMIDNEYSVAVQTVFKGNKVNKPSDPLKDGYIFVGWYTDSSLTTPFSFDTPIETNWTLYAKWTPKAAETDETIEYTIVSGAAQKWTKGSADSIEISAKRNLEDNTTLSHFVSLQIDGKSLVKDLDYTVRSGSVIATINPSALQNLGTGIHRITFVFDDGKAETTLTVEQSSDSSGSGSSGGGSSSGGSSSVPSTGDIFSNPFLWFGGMAIVIFFLKLFIDSRKKRLAEAEAMQNNKY